MESFETRVWLSSPTMHGDEMKYMQEAYDTNWMTTAGSNINALERLLQEYTHSEQAVALSSGTSALHLAMKLAGVKSGDYVFCSDMTFSATVNPVTYEGGIPIFIDSEQDTWNMDPELLEKAIIDRKEKTGKYPKAIIPVALYGMPYQIDKILAIADKYDIPVIEDAAEGMGSRFNGQVLGTFGMRAM